MKNFLAIILLLISENVYCQCYDAYYCITFDDTSCNYHVTIDTIGYPGNIFQIGNSQKAVLDSTVCSTVGIITDTTLPYPVNNHSVFTITNIATSGDVFGFKILSGNYYVQSDSLNDYGTIEISLDKGITWINMMDTAYSNNFLWWTAKPVLTGHSYVCKSFEVDLVNLISIHNFNIGDTILYRFSFFSDSIYDNLGGLVYDNFCFADFVEGISDIHFKPIKSTIYPNPSEGNFTIDFDNPDAEPFELAIYDICSKRMMLRSGITISRITIDCSGFKPGIYVYKITNTDAKKRTWGRFNVTK